jgi:hypothetical protein
MHVTDVTVNALALGLLLQRLCAPVVPWPQVYQSSGIAAPPLGPPPMGTPMNGAPDPEVLPPPPFGLVANATRGSGSGSISSSSYLRVSNTVSSSDDESYQEDQ